MTKINYTLLLLFISCLFVESQNTGVERNIYNLQTGFLGIWINNEHRLLNQISLRTEIGFDGSFRGCSGCTATYAIVPVINLKPRWYYNINKRNAKNQKTNNSANFITLHINYYPDWFVISNSDNAYITNQIALIPKWGIRRNIGNTNFNYEAGIGIGRRFYLDEKFSDTTADLHLRIGYTFK
ncbi:hypothetical protein [Flavobacterium sp. B183]|uniref:hypothetical protein n=1 Tax=Flavobacterium sp. B183 TaxID=907046 RepID=UPI00201FA7A1|nr:hypothetical protein [Flavobacterium sp. B183]URC10881.1 hypothetical protein M4I44_12345 [Flavobacterium sp. B183]